MFKLSGLMAVAISLAGVTAPSASFAQDKTVNVYSYRQPELIAPLLDAFTAETGITTRVLSLTDGLLERMQAEGKNSPADVIFTVDIGRLQELKDGGVTQAVVSDVIDDNIPAQYRDPDNQWFGLTMRGRVVYASRERVAQDSITYAELADPKWKGKVCTRSGQHVYNIGLIGAMIAHDGEAATEEWLRGVKANLARKPAGDDRAQAQAIYSGECDLALGNSYYVGLMRTNDENPEQKDWEASMKVLFPDSDGRGTNVNISGVAMAKYAPNRDNALKLMEFLSTAEAQEIYAEKVFEYPLKPGTQASDIVKSFGTLHPDSLPLIEIAKNRALASKLVDKVGFDD